MSEFLRFSFNSQVLRWLNLPDMSFFVSENVDIDLRDYVKPDRFDGTITRKVGTDQLPPDLSIISGRYLRGEVTEEATRTLQFVATENGVSVDSPTFEMAVAELVAPVLTSISNIQRITVGVTYSLTISQTASGTGVLTWTSTGLPPGFSINSSGVVSGIPTTSGIFTATITATGSAGSDSITVAFAILVDTSSTSSVISTIEYFQDIAIGSLTGNPDYFFIFDGSDRIYRVNSSGTVFDMGELPTYDSGFGIPNKIAIMPNDNFGIVYTQMDGGHEIRIFNNVSDFSQGPTDSGTRFDVIHGSDSGINSVSDGFYLLDGVVISFYTHAGVYESNRSFTFTKPIIDGNTWQGGNGIGVSESRIYVPGFFDHQILSVGSILNERQQHVLVFDHSGNRQTLEELVYSIFSDPDDELSDYAVVVDEKLWVGDQANERLVGFDI